MQVDELNKIRDDVKNLTTAFSNELFKHINESMNIEDFGSSSDDDVEEEEKESFQKHSEMSMIRSRESSELSKLDNGFAKIEKVGASSENEEEKESFQMQSNESLKIEYDDEPMIKLPKVAKTQKNSPRRPTKCYNYKFLEFKFENNLKIKTLRKILGRSNIVKKGNFGSKRYIMCKNCKVNFCINQDEKKGVATIFSKYEKKLCKCDDA